MWTALRFSIPCRTRWAVQIGGLNRQGVQAGLNFDNMRSSHIPLPPLAEQRRIAAILDQAEALRAKRRHALAQLDTLTQSLFLDLFGDPVTNPERLETLPLPN